MFRILSRTNREHASLTGCFMFLGIGLKLLKICSFEDDTSCFKIMNNARQIPVHIWYTQATCNESVSAFLDMGFQSTCCSVVRTPQHWLLRSHLSTFWTSRDRIRSGPSYQRWPEVHIYIGYSVFSFVEYHIQHVTLTAWFWANQFWKTVNVD